jgi:hypothetical protein
MKPGAKPRFWQRILFTLACVATALALFYRIEDYRGAAAWDRYRKDAEQRGVKLDFSDFVPTPVPDDENFAAIPELKALSSEEGPSVMDRLEKELPPNDYEGMLTHDPGKEAMPIDLTPVRDLFYKAKFLTQRTTDPAADILVALRRCDPILDPLREAASRPYSQLVVEDAEKGLGSSMHKASGSLSLGRVLKLECLAALETGDRARALTDLMVQERLSQMFQPEPTLLPAMLRVILIARVTMVIREGINQWSESDAATIEKSLQDVDLPADCLRGLAGERAQTDLYLDQIKGGPRQVWARDFDAIGWRLCWIPVMPKGWIDQNKVRLNEWYDGVLANPDDRRNSELAQSSRLEPYTFLAAMCDRFIGGNYEVAESCQDTLNLCRIGLALRRYCLRNGSYPDQLSELIPEFLPKIPVPATKGAAQTAYQRTPDGAILGAKKWVLRMPAS